MTTPFTYPPRGMSRIEAARYVGVSTTLFDEMVADGRMPKPKRVNSRTIWDRAELDIAFTDLPNDRASLRQYLLEQSGRVDQPAPFPARGSRRPDR